ncbi:MAG: histidine kinase [Bacteroidota bacterium]
MPSRPADPPARPPRLSPADRGWVVVAVGLAWMVPAAVALGQTYLQQALAGAVVDWPHAFWTTVPTWVLWMALTPLVVALARWATPEGGFRTVLVHALGITAAMVLHALGSMAAFQLGGLMETWTLDGFEAHVTLRAAVNAVAYAVVVGGTWAFDYARLAHARERQAGRLAAQLAEAELRVLKMQLNPHFLFNTLHSVATTVRKGEDRQAVTMLTRLGDLLRLALDTEGRQEVPLRQELDVVQRYLDIEAVRFGDRLRVEHDVSMAAASGRVPMWILQPLVENAIQHGIAPHAAEGTVSIRARKVGSGARAKLVLDVCDSGPGLSSDGRDRDAAVREGVGLGNVRARLDALYGPDADLAIDTAEGFCVTLTLPFVRADLRADLPDRPTPRPARV